MKRVVLFLLLAVVCSGQMCGAPDSGVPLSDGIPAGSYSGERTFRNTMYWDSDPPQSSEMPGPYSATFDSNGSYLVSEGLPLGVGFVSGSQESGIQRTITSIIKTPGFYQYTIQTDAWIPMEPWGACHFSGNQTDTYRFENGAVHYVADILLLENSDSVPGHVVSIHWQYEATLYP